ncbi:metalloregulator ArsR/SmtB family transcription factor [Mesorhizobium sp. NBSH29]|uniref:ArsR/SmtB family transcription factor n=1 Tax=Mesorhizobium sp. NBSH29 TaxID=2654249 RepID=UPI0018968A4A|nr:metalloregulator ArsR/SmtB family transcription factor [Mesorhizobium sp. NBSH29]QPC85342.1 metalloregulator ArsR/SmtB family transcription factor [Mesorhizobium sp. NBSH29]
MISTKLVRNVDRAAEFLTLLGNSKRLLIVSYLLDGELSVGAIADRVSLSQSALSQHLAKLRSCNLVETRRDRQMIYYSCKSVAVRRLFLTLDDIYGESGESESTELPLPSLAAAGT